MGPTLISLDGFSLQSSWSAVTARSCSFCLLSPQATAVSEQASCAGPVVSNESVFLPRGMVSVDGRAGSRCSLSHTLLALVIYQHHLLRSTEDTS